MKKLKNAFYYFLYGSFIINYKTNYKLYILLIYLNEIGIKSFTKQSEYISIIIFNDNTEFIFWNENRWYAWMRTGEIKFSNGKKLNWDGEMPPFEVLFKYKKLIKKLERKIDTNFSEYLPTQLIRKYKLQKLGITKKRGN